MTIKRGTEIPTIDVALVTVKAEGSEDEIALDTASQVEVEPLVEETDATKLIVKGILRAQKPKKTTLTGHEIKLTDNVFTPELVKVLQGGEIKYWTSAEHTDTQTEETEFGVAGYTPPLVGVVSSVKPFTLNLYSAQYDAAGLLVRYEKIMYPNCLSTPVAFSSEDDTFRSPEYTITSTAKKGEAPYDMDYVDELPVITG